MLSWTGYILYTLYIVGIMDMITSGCLEISSWRFLKIFDFIDFPAWNNFDHRWRKKIDSAAVYRILDILVRIQVRGSVSLTNGSGSGSGSCFFSSVIFKTNKNIFAWWWKDPDQDPFLWLADPDLGGPKGFGSYASGSRSWSGTLFRGKQWGQSQLPTSMLQRASTSYTYKQ
jgi:hypothetical protein